ncbi:MAG: NAD(P)-dependent glycerol-3-phosphate dehydrogenase [Phycisphaerae bacterium]|nr:NAD(P)-dependent glycerol-3-phosphate dehydrogenase [Phycisphaerae bacterium]
MSEKIVVIGDGAMGTVCGLILANKGYSVTMWGHSDEQLRMIDENRENTRFLPGVKLPIAMQINADDQAVFKDAALIISAVPCVFLRGVWKRLAPFLPANTPIVSLTKGLEFETLERPTEIIGSIVSPRPLAVFSGPNIADELARSLPATATVAFNDLTLAQQIQKTFATSWLRVYTNSDVIGAEIAGATKNVIAIAAGVIDGLQGGDNAKAALLTRGLVEISRLGVAMGAKAETFMGLSGIGDLITTCYSPHGRNRTFGQMIGSGQTVEEALDNIPGQVEGVNTTRSLQKLADKYQVEMPIAHAVHEIIFDNKDVAAAITELMTRELKPESQA